MGKLGLKDDEKAIPHLSYENVSEEIKEALWQLYSSHSRINGADYVSIDDVFAIFEAIEAGVERIMTEQEESLKKLYKASEIVNQSDLEKWLKTFKQIQRPTTTDRLVVLKLDPEEYSQKINDTEYLQELHHAHNQRHRTANLFFYGFITSVMTMIALKRPALIH